MTTQIEQRSEPRRRESALGFAILTLLFAPAAGQAQGSAEGVACIKDMQVPAYTYVARRSPSGGTVGATITIGDSGRAETISLDGGDPDLKEEVRLFLGPATFLDTCAGKRITLLFTFQLQGEAEPNPPVYVRFRAPNQFVIVSRPRSADFSTGKRR